MTAPSTTQLAVLRLAALGRSNREIGRQLWMAEDTVKTHLRTLFRRFGARDRAHAVSIAVVAGYLELVPAEAGFDVVVHENPARRYDLAKFLPPSREEREAGQVPDVAYHVFTGLQGYQPVNHSRACIAVLGDLEDCRGECLQLVCGRAS